VRVGVTDAGVRLTMGNEWECVFGGLTVRVRMGVGIRGAVGEGAEIRNQSGNASGSTVGGTLERRQVSKQKSSTAQRAV
jgi:hypothetical protein